MTTGFNAYHLYNAVRYMHFGGAKYDVTKMGLPRKGVFLKKWNEQVIHRKESLLFMKLDKLFEGNRAGLARLYAYYWLENPSFYVTDIFDDDLAVHRKYETELGMIRDVVEKDLYATAYLAASNGMRVQDMMRPRKGLPLVFSVFDRKRIGVHGLLAFHLAWGVGKWVRTESDFMNVVEEEKAKKYRLIIDKYLAMVYKYYDFDIRDFIRESLRKIRKE